MLKCRTISSVTLTRYNSARRRTLSDVVQKNVDSSSKSNPTEPAKGHREKKSSRALRRIPCVVVEKITTRRREGVGVVVGKKKVDELSTKIRVIYLQQ